MSTCKQGVHVIGGLFSGRIRAFTDPGFERSQKLIA